MANNIFSTDSNKKDTGFTDKIDTHSKAILSIIQRQKDIDSSLDLLNERLELIDHNSIKSFKKLLSDIKSLKSDSLEIKKNIKKIEEFNSKLQKQLALYTTKDEVLKLEKYIDLWEPINFVTRDELEEINKTQLKKFKNVIKEKKLENSNVKLKADSIVTFEDLEENNKRQTEKIKEIIQEFLES